VFLALLRALILDVLASMFRITAAPAQVRLNRERAAHTQAVRLALHDMQVEIANFACPTFRHHHDQTRARHGL